MIAAATASAHPALAAGAPAGVDLRLLDRVEALEDADFVVVADALPGLLDALREAPAVRVVQVLSAGTDWIERAVPPWAALCNGRGTRDVPMAEWVVGALLGAATGLLAGARRTTWRDDVQPVELAGTTVVVLGHGSIGRAVAERLAPLRVKVVGVARTARDGVHAVDELDDLLAAADALVVLAPLTDATRGMVDARRLALLRDGALVVNAGRGPVVDTDALVAETASGRLRAVLDVVDPEPLPDGHPLWTAPGVLAITPHHAGDSVAADRRATALAAEQLGRYARGEPLVNVVLAAGR